MSKLSDALLNEVKGDFGGFTEEELSGITEIMKMYKFKNLSIGRDGITFNRDNKGDVTIVEVVKGTQGKLDKIDMSVKIMKRDTFTYNKNELGDMLETTLSNLLINDVN